MGAFAVGQIVVLPFPFSDLSDKKYRPALLLANTGKGDWIACQITSNAYADNWAIEINDTDFITGSLQRISYARAGKLFTAHHSLFTSIAGEINATKLLAVREAVVALLRED
ncbi:MAG: type II toxin-antitoxin system PemK/MazF family toxin [Methylococcales bacterium]